MKKVVTATIAGVLTALLLPGASIAADDPQAPSAAVGQAAQSAQGPLVLQPVRNGWIVVPEVKFADVDKKLGTLVGGYGGWVVADTLIIGGGGYWLANHPNSIDMAYGGLVVGWIAPMNSAIRFGAHALVGAGSARVPGQSIVEPEPFGMGDMRGFDGRFFRGGMFREDFFVFDPQADVVIRLADWMHVNLGVGYRVLGAQTSAVDRLRGASGSFAIRFGGGS